MKSTPPTTPKVDMTHGSANEEGAPLHAKQRSWYDGNVTFWWLLGAVLGLWFTVYKGLGILFGLLPLPSSPPMGYVFPIHLVTATLFMCICIVNVFHTPSHGPTYRNVHIVVGRMAMISGLLSFVSGAVVAWWERYTGDLGFAIGITVGGVLQVTSQVTGWFKIRQKDVSAHKEGMLMAFFYGCLIPMWMRLVSIFFGGSQNTPEWMMPVVVVCAVIFGQLGLRAAMVNRFI